METTSMVTVNSTEEPKLMLNIYSTLVDSLPDCSKTITRQQKASKKNLSTDAAHLRVRNIKTWMLRTWVRENNSSSRSTKTPALINLLTMPKSKNQLRRSTKRKRRSSSPSSPHLKPKSLRMVNLSTRSSSQKPMDALIHLLWAQKVPMREIWAQPLSLSRHSEPFPPSRFLTRISLKNPNFKNSILKWKKMKRGMRPNWNEKKS